MQVSLVASVQHGEVRNSDVGVNVCHASSFILFTSKPRRRYLIDTGTRSHCMYHFLTFPCTNWQSAIYVYIHTSDGTRTVPATATTCSSETCNTGFIRRPQGETQTKSAQGYRRNEKQLNESRHDACCFKRIAETGWTSAGASRRGLRIQTPPPVLPRPGRRRSCSSIACHGMGQRLSAGRSGYLYLFLSYFLFRLLSVSTPIWSCG